MAQQSQSVPEYFPHLVILVTLLVVEYWTFMSHGASLIGSGDYGVFIGIPFLLSLAMIVIIAYGLLSVCGGKSQYGRIVTICLILFIVQMALILVEYAALATGALG